RAMADAAFQIAAELALDVLAGVEQLLGPELGLDPDARVEEVGLVEHLAHGVGLVGRRRGEHVHAARRQELDGALQVRAAVADIRAQPEVARHGDGALSSSAIRAASALRPLSGRTNTVKSSTRSSSLMRNRSMPSTSRSPTSARKTSACTSSPAWSWSV